MTGSGAINFVKDLTPDDLQSETRYDGFRRACARSKAYLTLWALTSGKPLNVAVADPDGTKTDTTLDRAVPLPIRLLRPRIMHGPGKAAQAFTKAGHDLSLVEASARIILPTSETLPPDRFRDRAMGEAFGDRLADLIGPAGQHVTEAGGTACSDVTLVHASPKYPRANLRRPPFSGPCVGKSP